MPWQGDRRTSTSAWRRLKAAVIRRDGNQCSRCGADGKLVRLDLDHIVNVASGGTDSADNARLLCRACHTPKTQAEAAAARAAKRARLRLPAEDHPGRPPTP